MPPSIFIVVPVTDAWIGLARNIIALAISLGETNLPIGWRDSSAVLAAFASGD
jgi:hypothetical protein